MTPLLWCIHEMGKQYDWSNWTVVIEHRLVQRMPLMVGRSRPLQLTSYIHLWQILILCPELSCLSYAVVQLYSYVQLLGKLSVSVWFLMSDVGIDDQFDVLCQYLGLPASLSVLFSQSDVLRQLVPRSAVSLWNESLDVCHRLLWLAFVWVDLDEIWGTDCVESRKELIKFWKVNWWG